jgi:peptide/nickel transport system substrate-binding protein
MRTPTARRRASLAGLLAIGLLAAACGSSDSGSGSGVADTGGATAQQRTLRIAIPGDVETLDPAFGQAELTNLVLKNVYLQPIQYLPGEFKDGVAYADTTSYEGQSLESWTFSEDRRTITLKVRQGLTFPNSGNPVTAQDFLWTLERALGTMAGPAWVWGNIGVTDLGQVQLVDDSTIVITGARPSSIAEPLMRDQTLGLLDSVEVKKHATADDPWALTWLSQNYAGNGRYLVDSWDKGSKMTLVANPEWPGDEPYFTRIELIVVPQSSNRLALLQSGDVDLAFDLSTQELGTAAASAGVNVMSIADRQALNLGMNLRNAPFDDVRVRQALSYAAPYAAIVDGVLQGRAVPSQGPISVNSRFFPLYDLGDLWPYSTDLDKARALLAEAGLANGFSFELIIPQGLPYVEAAAANLKSAFAEIGVDMTIAPVSSASMAEKLAQRDFQAFMRGYLTDYVDDPYYHFFLWWGTDVVLNWVGYSNATVDEAYLSMAEVADDTIRRDAYRTAIGQVIADAPMLWLANANYTLAMRDDITGYVHHPDTLVFFSPLGRKG